MSRRIILLFVVAMLLATVCGGSLPAQAMTPVANIEWMHQFGAFTLTPLYDSPSAITVHGDLYLVGITAYPGGAAVATVSRLDRQGDKVWYRQFGNGDTYAFGVAADSSGIYVAGMTSDPISGQARYVAKTAYIRKYDFAGSELWTRQFGTQDRDGAYDVAVDSSGVYVVGETYGAIPGQTWIGDFDAYIRKYDFAGNEIWTRQFGTFVNDGAYYVAVDSSGVYLAGSTYGALPGQTSSGGVDAYIRKYDVDGNELWTSQFGSQSRDGASDVAVDSSGVYVVGATAGALPGQTSAGDQDAYVRKYDVDGNELWTRQFGSSEWDNGAYGVGTDGSGVYVIGGVGSALPGQTSVGDQDAYIR